MPRWCTATVSWSSFGCGPWHDDGQLSQRTCRTACAESIDEHAGRRRRGWSLAGLSFRHHPRKSRLKSAARFLSGFDWWSSGWRSIHSIDARLRGWQSASPHPRRCSRRKSQLQHPRPEVALRALRSEFRLPQFAGDGHLWALRVRAARSRSNQGKRPVRRLPLSTGWFSGQPVEWYVGFAACLSWRSRTPTQSSTASK